MAVTFLTNEDEKKYVKTINDTAPDENGNIVVKGEGIAYDNTVSGIDATTVQGAIDKLSGGNAALTTAQIEALHGMFKVCAYNGSKDVSGAYAAFKTAFGITDSGEGEPDEPVVPDEPDTPEVTLSSISATYSGGDVAVGTAVSSLTGIVVTAHYSDGTSETVTGYTLSGTIAEGSNTVTVSYGGKTATFTVTGVAESGGEESEGVAVAMLDAVKSLATTNIYFYSDDSLRTAQADGVTDYVKVNGTAFNWYSDEGDTTYSDSITAKNNNSCVTSKNVFAEDTEVKILIHTGASQVYDSYIIGCTDWDGISTPYENNVYNCQAVGAGGWTASDHEITYTVKAGTRLLVANYTSTNQKVFILNPDTALNGLTVDGRAMSNIAASEKVFDTDTVVRITASDTESHFDACFIGCIDEENVAANSHVYWTQLVGDIAWESPYALDVTYTVKAGYRLVFGSQWDHTVVASFAVMEVV